MNKTLKLNQFEFIDVESAAITLTAFECMYENDEENTEVTVYSPSLILWIDTEKTKQFPIILPLQISLENKYMAIEEALKCVIGISTNIVGDVTIMNEEGESIETITSEQFVNYSKEHGIGNLFSLQNAPSTDTVQ